MKTKTPLADTLSRSWGMTLHDNAQRRKRWELDEVKEKWYNNQNNVTKELLKPYAK